MTIRVIGMDLSLNHGGVVELEDGELGRCWFWTTKAGQAEKKGGTRLILDKSDDKQVIATNRLVFCRDWIRTVLESRKPDFIGLEDYAIREEQGAHYLGEIGGIARLTCLDLGLKLRLHDPTSVRMFATLNGNCPKALVEGIIKERWGADFSKVRVKIKKKDGSIEEDVTTSGDLADAFAVARLVWTEVLLRDGRLRLSDIKEEKERRVFQRVTKTYPINLLDREWITRTP